MTYLSGEVSLPFPIIVGALLVLILFTLISLCGLRDSARLALAVLTLHVSAIFLLHDGTDLYQLVTMTVLFVASAVGWARMGNSQIRSNWDLGRQDTAASSVARQLFDGVCIGVLGLTGFECKYMLFSMCRGLTLTSVL